MLVGLPVILLVEFVLIRQRILIRIMSLIERSMHWQIIHIPQAHRGSPTQERNYTEFSQHIEHFHKVPRGVFLGLFAYLIVHWIFKLDNFGTEIILFSLLYIALLALVGVLSTAFETDLVFVDPSKGRLIPIDQWVESLLKPLVGVGLKLFWPRSPRRSTGRQRRIVCNDLPCYSLWSSNRWNCLPMGIFIMARSKSSAFL